MRASRWCDAASLEHIYALLMPPHVLVCRLMEATGLRVTDALSIRTADLKQRMTVRERKTGKSRRVYIPAALLHQLQAQAGPVYVFESPRCPGQPRTRQAVWQDIHRAARACRYRGTISPHSLRKAYAVRLYHRTGDLGAVQAALGHSSPEVTAIYALADILAARSAG